VAGEAKRLGFYVNRGVIPKNRPQFLRRPPNFRTPPPRHPGFPRTRLLRHTCMTPAVHRADLVRLLRSGGRHRAACYPLVMQRASRAYTRMSHASRPLACARTRVRVRQLRRNARIFRILARVCARVVLAFEPEGADCGAILARACARHACLPASGMPALRIRFIREPATARACGGR
jgi:hypothetical protein